MAKATTFRSTEPCAKCDNPFRYVKTGKCVKCEAVIYGARKTRKSKLELVIDQKPKPKMDFAKFNVGVRD